MIFRDMIGIKYLVREEDETNTDHFGTAAIQNSRPFTHFTIIICIFPKKQTGKIHYGDNYGIRIALYPEWRPMRNLFSLCKQDMI